MPMPLSSQERPFAKLWPAFSVLCSCCAFRMTLADLGQFTALFYFAVLGDFTNIPNMNGLRVPRQRVALANGHAATPNGAQPGRRPVLARMMKPEINTDDTPGIDTLLERDYK